MQLLPDEIQLFEQLGRNPVFRNWMEREGAEIQKVLDENADPVQLYRSQGGRQLLNRMKRYLTARSSPQAQPAPSRAF